MIVASKLAPRRLKDRLVFWTLYYVSDKRIAAEAKRRRKRQQRLQPTPYRGWMHE